MYFFFSRNGNCLLFDRQSLQHHSDRQQWAAIPKHSGQWNWQSHNEGKRTSHVLTELFFAGLLPVVYWTLLFLQILLEKNVKFHMSDHVTEIKGVDGKVKCEIHRLQIQQTMSDILFWNVQSFLSSVSFSRWRRSCFEVEKLSQQILWLLVLVRAMQTFTHLHLFIYKPAFITLVFTFFSFTQCWSFFFF